MDRASPSPWTDQVLLGSPVLPGAHVTKDKRTELGRKKSRKRKMEGKWKDRSLPQMSVVLSWEDLASKDGLVFAGGELSGWAGLHARAVKGQRQL